jgi:hypothetical protein
MHLSRRLVLELEQAALGAAVAERLPLRRREVTEGTAAPESALQGSAFLSGRVVAAAAVVNRTIGFFCAFTHMRASPDAEAAG